MKHTEGPWSLKIYEDGSARIQHPVIDPFNTHEHVDFSYLNPQGMANLNLTLAAPELLIALKNCVSDLESFVTSEYEGTSILKSQLKALKPYKKIIDKAEGRNES